ncbi:hypothetical protein LWI28_000106 [Acer negundo]|uniref:Glycosyl transferase 64 domain-containing protein n=1 Tax=Acer negundo TaxID=4023 RepID=A0AAD5NX50_ACENE|nr:hypothetical protein LWI28_000106 [Acer negundo]
MNPVISVFFVFLLVILNNTVLSIRTVSSSDTCDPANQRDPQSLRWDQITVLINGYSEHRIPLLQSIAAAYSASPIVSSVLVLWGNPSTSTEILSQLSRNLSLSSLGTASISLVRQSTSSLNARFIPRSSIRTHAVLICDDDVEIDRESFVFAFRVWQSNSDRLIGTFVRSHDVDLSRREWIYTVHPDKYSIVLTKFMILKNNYLWNYSCGGGATMAETRRIVDEMRNCEDILMNFVVAEETNAGPVMVGAERVRDWGDSRNENNGGQGLRSRISSVGLSSRRSEHRKRRGRCLMEFHRVLGRMPLRYSYGKVVDSVGEQGLCEKGGKLLFWKVAVMKRKVFEDPLSFPSKSRRLDDKLLQVSIEEPRNIENVDGLETERALVVYSPTNTPFLRSPTSPDFSFIVNSDLVPGLKDVIFWSENSIKVRPADDTNDCLAVVPWIKSQFHQASPTEPPTESELMESEDLDMMDTEDHENCGMVEANTGLQFWQQQKNQQPCMSPQLLQNRSL